MNTVRAHLLCLQRHSEHLVSEGPSTKQFCFSRIFFTLDLGIFSHSREQDLIPYLPDPLCRGQQSHPCNVTGNAQPPLLLLMRGKQKWAATGKAKKKAERVFLSASTFQSLIFLPVLKYIFCFHFVTDWNIKCNLGIKSWKERVGYFVTQSILLKNKGVRRGKGFAAWAQKRIFLTCLPAGLAISYG